MAKIIETSSLKPASLTPQEREYVYNGLDAACTFELLEVLHPQLDNLTDGTYRFSKSLQGPVLEMRLRGVLVDKPRRLEVLDQYYQQLEHYEDQLNLLVCEGLGLRSFNWRSPPQLQEVFYGRLGIPPIRKQGSITVDRNALEKMDDYLVARPILTHLELLRDIAKKISVLTAEIDSDGRIRSQYNIAGTNTGRFSSSLSEFGTGGNLQNIEDLLRSVLIADPGMKMGYFDAEQGESRVVGAIEYALFNDSRYLDACEGGDLHTAVAKLIWPKLNWSGTPEADKALAEQPYYRHYSRRFMCKKVGHGTNYKGQPPTIAREAKVDIDIIQEFQPIYLKAFPAHSQWWSWVESELQKTGTIINLTGRKRQFWGRRTNPATIREAIAYNPQGSLADIVNQGGLQVWRGRLVQLLMQNHDAWVFQYPEEEEDEIIPKVLHRLRYPIPVRDREFVIPYGCKTGWNFGEFNGKTNPHGLKPYKGTDKRSRPEVVPFLDRRVR